MIALYPIAIQVLTLHPEINAYRLLSGPYSEFVRAVVETGDTYVRTRSQLRMIGRLNSIKNRFATWEGVQRGLQKLMKFDGNDVIHIRFGETGKPSLTGLW